MTEYQAHLCPYCWKNSCIAWRDAETYRTWKTSCYADCAKTFMVDERFVEKFSRPAPGPAKEGDERD